MTSMKVFLGLLAFVASAHAQILTTTQTTTQTTTVTQTWVTVTQTYCPAVYQLIIKSPATVTLLSTTSNYTILCPSNTALSTAQVPDFLSVQQLISYHIVFGIVTEEEIKSGSTLVTAYQGKRLSYRRNRRNRRSVEINGDRSHGSVIRGDIRINKGLVHVIDTVLIPVKPVCVTIYGTISANKDLSTLKAVIDAAGVDHYLMDSGLVGTVFAPTNKAFDQLFKALHTDVKTVLKSRDLLVTILSNHVVPGAAVKSTSLRNGQRFTTLLKSTLQIGVGRRIVTVRSFKSKSFAIVTKANVGACKAVIHVIDRVLVPVVAAKKPSRTWSHRG